MFPWLWGIWSDRRWTVTASRWVTRALWWRSISLGSLLLLLRVTLFMWLFAMRSGVSRFTLIGLWFWWWVLAWLRLLVTIFRCMMLIFWFASLLAFLDCRVFMAANLCCNLPRHWRFQTRVILMSISLILFFLPAISDRFYKVTLWWLLLQISYASVSLPLVVRVVRYFDLVWLWLPRLSWVYPSGNLIVISMWASIADLLLCTICITLVLRVLNRLLFEISYSSVMLLILLQMLIVVSCWRWILWETLTVIVWGLGFTQKVVVVAMFIECIQLYLRISQTCESAILSKLLLNSCCFLLARAEIVGDQGHIMNSGILEMLRHLLVPWITISSSASNCPLRPLWASRSWICNRVLRVLRLRKWWNLALICKMRLSSHRLKEQAIAIESWDIVWLPFRYVWLLKP